MRSELAVVESTTVSLPDLVLALGEEAGVTGMQRWLGKVMPAGTMVEYQPLGQQFVLRREGTPRWADR